VLPVSSNRFRRASSDKTPYANVSSWKAIFAASRLSSGTLSGCTVSASLRYAERISAAVEAVGTPRISYGFLVMGGGVPKLEEEDSSSDILLGSGLFVCCLFVKVGRLVGWKWGFESLCLKTEFWFDAWVGARHVRRLWGAELGATLAWPRHMVSHPKVPHF